MQRSTEDTDAGLDATGLAPTPPGEPPPTLSEKTGLFVLRELERQSRAFPIPDEERERLVGIALTFILARRSPQLAVTRAWVASILKTIRRRMVRDRLPVRLIPLDELPESEHPSLPPEPPRLAFTRLLDALSEDERLVVALRLRGFTWKQALGQVGVPLGSHSFWRRRMLRKLESLAPRAAD